MELEGEICREMVNWRGFNHVRKAIIPLQLFNKILTIWLEHISEVGGSWRSQDVRVVGGLVC